MSQAGGLWTSLLSLLDLRCSCPQAQHPGHDNNHAKTQMYSLVPEIFQTLKLQIYGEKYIRSSHKIGLHALSLKTKSLLDPKGGCWAAHVLSHAACQNLGCKSKCHGFGIFALAINTPLMFIPSPACCINVWGFFAGFLVE